MNLSDRDRKVAMIGAGLAVAIIILGYVVIPGARKWSEARGAVSSRVAQVDDLKERVRSQESLLKQRSVLVARLGSLFEAPASPKVAKTTTPSKPASGRPTATAKGPTGGPSKPESEPDSPAAAAKTSAPAEAPKPEAVKPEEKKAEAPPVEPAKVELSKAEPVKTEAPKAEAPKAESEKPAPPAPVNAPAEPAKAEDAKPEASKPGEKKAEDKKSEGPPKEGGKPTGKPERASKPTSPEGATLAGYIEQNAKKAGVNVKSITPERTSAGLKGIKQYRSVTLQVKLECPLQGFTTLLHALEKGERFVKIEQVQLRRDLSKEGNMDVTLNVRAYEATARPS